MSASKVAEAVALIEEARVDTYEMDHSEEAAVVRGRIESALAILRPLAAEPDPQERVVELLRKIAAGKGAFRIDRFEHHVNIIEESMAAAREALELLGVEPGSEQGAESRSEPGNLADEIHDGYDGPRTEPADAR